MTIVIYKHLRIMLLLVLILVFANLASASLNVPTEINFGELSRNQTKSTTFSITNDGSTALTNINLSSNAKFNVKFDQNGFNLSPGASKNVQITITVPDNANTGNNISIGSVLVTSDQVNTSIPIKATIIGELAITELRVNVDYSPSYAFRKSSDRKGSTSAFNGAKLDVDIEPDSDINFDIKVENRFSGDKNDIRDVEATVTINEIDDGEDIEQSSASIDLEPGEEQWLPVKIKIPKRVEQKSYNINIFVDGSGENGQIHTVEWDLEMTVKKESHDVRFETVNLQQNMLSCGENTNIIVGIYNAGRNAENNLKLEVKNSDLNLNYVKTGISLEIETFDEDSEYETKVPIFTGDNIKAGVYPIKANLYWQESVLFDERIVNLEVKCDAIKLEEDKKKIEKEGKIDIKEEKEGEGREEVKEVKEVKEVIVPIPVGNLIKEPEEPVSVSKEYSLKDSPFYLPIILGANFVILIFVFALVIYLGKSRFF